MKKIFNKKIKQMENQKRGSELSQTVLITAIMIMIVATVFFPQIKALLEGAMTSLSGWFNQITQGL